MYSTQPLISENIVRQSLNAIASLLAEQSVRKCPHPTTVAKTRNRVVNGSLTCKLVIDFWRLESLHGALSADVRARWIIEIRSIHHQRSAKARTRASADRDVSSDVWFRGSTSGVQLECLAIDVTPSPGHADDPPAERPCASGALLLELLGLSSD